MNERQDFIYEITKKISDLGRNNRNIPTFYEVEPFKQYFSKEGKLRYDELDEFDGGFTRREILVRYLLVSVVLDQGPDMKGVGKLLNDVTSYLYRREIRIFHRPLDFFKELGISIDEILNKHESVKEIRAEKWAKENNSTPSKYNLFFAQSMRGIISTKQVLDYSIHRWGVPLCVPLLLEKDLQKSNKESSQPLIDYIESWDSAEIMAQQLKDNERYGLGSAIGDKACHLFAKMYVSIYKFIKHKLNDAGWGDISYEVPFDSNAGRVLFRTGFLSEWASLKEYEYWNVIQRDKGKDGTHYIRVTNIRGKRTQNIPQIFFKGYIDIVSNYLKIGRSPRSIEIQRIPNLIIYELLKEGYQYSVADFDDGLMYVGTNYCFNNEKPQCQECPLKDLCKGHKTSPSLVKDYRT